nr:hypothetical protein [Tanacetum cinerariifolium]
MHDNVHDEIKEILKDNLLKVRNLTEDTDNKLDISLEVNSNDEELKTIIEKRNEIFVTFYNDLNKKVEEHDEDKDMDLEKDDDDDETDDKDDDDMDENIDKNDENDENIRNVKEKKIIDEGNKEEGGSKNVKDDNVEEVITDVEQKDENVEEEKEKKLESEKIRDPSLVVHYMIKDMKRLPLISGALKEAAHDVPPVDARKCKCGGSTCSEVINAAKDKIVQVTKKEVPKKINVKVTIKTSAKAVEVPPDKVVDATKKKVAAMTQFK